MNKASSRAVAICGTTDEFWAGAAYLWPYPVLVG